ncbi:MAG TPA: AGE family epimerase/isomerase [Bacteroidales bacterium]|jgi:mannobiose 2-epimerase|nr:AGE family epimerase/isomerase [Bacteroidales bacterium]HQH23850.1 AGE family epimerase/isomerase [Bacteroidales bacterium]HQJ83146.1 AGE family epimerase/isomerase [Bacteroidales bacterium]
MKKQLFILIILAFLSSYAGKSQIPVQAGPGQKLAELKNQLANDLKNNILPYWSSKMPDEINGGFFGRIDASNRVIHDASKGGILNARILWTWSAAYRVTGNPEYLRLATRARNYILSNFIDRKHGGAYMTLNHKGEIQDDRKHTYTQTFFIYGLSEYARATGDRKALKEAKNIFKALEKNALDREANGYFEVFSRDWQRLHDRLIGEKSPADEKSMNTSLHIMEAYANLYRVWPTARMAERLRNMVNIFLDHIIDKNTHHLIYFLDRNWNSTSGIDSYGHDIEASWLIYEAATLLGDPELIRKAREASVAIADAAAEGLMPDGSMLSEKDRETGRIRDTRGWWDQAEAVVGYVNAYELTENEDYLNMAVKTWNFIEKYLIDRINGGWFAYVSPEGTPGGDKAGTWICPYHNSRMCLEIMERVK